jgi:probable rRNA maturation factor
VGAEVGEAQGEPPGVWAEGASSEGEAQIRRLYTGPWRVEVTVRPGVSVLLPFRSLARLAARTLEAAGAPRPASVGIILSHDRELSELNARHMGVAGPTDVLSFPLFPPDAFPPHPGEPPGRRESLRGGEGGPRSGLPFVLPPGRRPHLGDVVVSVERAVEQAKGGRGGQTGNRRWEPVDELRLLVVHGILHLCAWDHAQAEEEAAMRALEAEILAGR